MNVVVGVFPLTLEEMIALGRPETQLTIADSAWTRIANARDIADEELARGSIVYGLTVGLGSNVTMPIERSSVPDYERKVISARIVGVGDPLSEESCRRALGLRIVNLGLGYSAVSPNVVEQLRSEEHTSELQSH